ncbi:MAG: glycosylhydrolase-like jelly roll fold domain-containing protein, partial [Mucilaginibacter sp.]
LDCNFRITGIHPEIWDPVTGNIRKAHSFKQSGGQTSLPLFFAENQSYFIVFRRANKIAGSAAGTGQPNFPAATQVAEIKGPWKIKFDTRLGGHDELEFSGLEDWSAHPENSIKYYSGPATYINRFNFTKNTGGLNILLHLGVVKDIAQVFVNGIDAGVVWTAPWQIDISKYIIQGSNQLEIIVANQWTNRIIGDASLPDDKKITNTNIKYPKDKPLSPSGLLGPVNLISIPEL